MICTRQLFSWFVTFRIEKSSCRITINQIDGFSVVSGKANRLRAKTHLSPCHCTRQENPRSKAMWGIIKGSAFVVRVVLRLDPKPGQPKRLRDSQITVDPRQRPSPETLDTTKSMRSFFGRAKICARCCKISWCRKEIFQSSTTSSTSS